MRKILGAKFQADKTKLMSNEAIYRKTAKISDRIRKRRNVFYSHLTRMNNNRITKKIIDFFQNRKTKTKWFHQVNEDLRELNISEETIRDRILLRQKLSEDNIRFQVVKKETRKHTEEWKREASARMKKYWAEKKKKQCSRDK